MAIAAHRSCLHSTIDPENLYSADPLARVEAARGLGRKDQRLLIKRAQPWPAYSPGTVNAWLLLVTTKPPSWRDPLLEWPAAPPTLGLPHEGFFYPDPMGFWAEVRRWLGLLLRRTAPDASLTDALSASALLHLGDEVHRLRTAMDLCRPKMVVFLDEEARITVGAADGGEPFSIPDPHRAGTAYHGWWRSADDGVVTGKAPQHPASHNFYRREDMDAYLLAAPTPGG